MIDDFSKIERGDEPPKLPHDGNRKVHPLVRPAIGKIEWDACYTCAHYTDPGCACGFENIESVVEISIEDEKIYCGFWKPNDNHQPEQA